MSKKLKININFTKDNRHIYDFIKKQPNQSLFIRVLVEACMNGIISSEILQLMIENENSRNKKIKVIEPDTKKNQEYDIINSLEIHTIESMANPYKLLFKK